MQKRLLLATGIIASSLILTTTTLAANTNNNNINNGNSFKFHQEKGRGAFGTITSVSGNTITITTRERGNESEVTKTVTVSSDTKYTKDRETTISLSDLANGQKVMIRGTTDNSGNITATMINVETKVPKFKGPSRAQK